MQRQFTDSDKTSNLRPDSLVDALWETPAMESRTGQPDCKVEAPCVTRLTTVDDTQRIPLARRPEEYRFAPQQYYYAASRSGVVPGDSASRHNR